MKVEHCSLNCSSRLARALLYDCIPIDIITLSTLIIATIPRKPKCKITDVQMVVCSATHPKKDFLLLSLSQTLSTFHYTLLDKCPALLSVVERGWPNALDFSLDLELNIPRMYYLMNKSFMECFVHYLMNSNCTCVRSTTLDNFALDHTSLDNKQSFRLHATRWPNAKHFTQHACRVLYSEKSRAFGQGFREKLIDGKTPLPPITCISV